MELFADRSAGIGKPAGSGDSYFMRVQVSAFVCSGICGSRVSDALQAYYLEDGGDGGGDPDSGIRASDGCPKT